MDLLLEKLFGISQNVLEVLARGTDYITLKKKETPITLSAEIMIEDDKKFDNDNKYDFIFLVIEDELLIKKFKKNLGINLNF